MKEWLGERSVLATAGGAAQELDFVLAVPERLVLGRTAGLRPGLERGMPRRLRDGLERSDILPSHVLGVHEHVGDLAALQSLEQGVEELAAIPAQLAQVDGHDVGALVRQQGSKRPRGRWAAHTAKARHDLHTPDAGRGRPRHASEDGP